MMSSPVKLHDVQLRDLASVLRKKFGTKVEVVKFDTESLLPMGENYGSTILKVHATVKRNDKAEEEELNLVAKLLPATDFQRSIFDSTYTFKKEAFLYEELIPSYQSLEREFGVPEDEVFDVVPEFFGARFSLRGDGEEVDDDAVILMQNLKILGYYTADRRNGLDFEHAKVAVLALSRFHALGMAMKRHRPDFFEILKVRSKCLTISESGAFDESTKHYIRLLCEDPELSQYSDRLNAAMSQETAKTWTAVPPEPWSTIVHADFWVNNIMFRRASAAVNDVKFVDFQNYLFMSPLRELTFFLTTSCDADVMADGFDELLDCYHANFVRVLERMGCDVEPFRRDKFDERLRIDAYDEFPHCPFMLKIMTATVDASVKPEEIMELMFQDGDNLKENSMFLPRLRRCVRKFVEKGWL